MELGSLEPGAIISYHRMCTEEHEVRLQRGMNFRLDPRYSVMLMNRRDGAPYADSVDDGGDTLIYEGHDASRTRGGPDPASIDQPLTFASGKATQNGLFREAALAYREGRAAAEQVKVYEKLLRGTWVFNGVFRLTDCWAEEHNRRSVLKFRLEPVGEGASPAQPALRERSRMIPSSVKREVWERDRGRCVICEETDELHFDHDIPYSAGGSSVTAANIRILCARHNLEKSDRIE
ncbi:MAG: HNH endonuclease [Chloroflexi bacterium]|nr:HNH endonuclease [Chloroflexota bacterium]